MNNFENQVYKKLNEKDIKLIKQQEKNKENDREKLSKKQINNKKGCLMPYVIKSKIYFKTLRFFYSFLKNL